MREELDLPQLIRAGDFAPIPLDASLRASARLAPDSQGDLGPVLRSAGSGGLLHGSPAGKLSEVYKLDL